MKSASSSANLKPGVFGQNLKSKLAAFVVVNSVIATQLFFIALCFSKHFRPLMFLYIVFILLDTRWKSGGVKSLAFRNSFVWELFSDYFPVKLIKEKDLDKNKRYIFGYHPHGVISLGAVVALGSDGAGFSKTFPGIVNRLSTLSTNFYLPFHREITLRLGFISCSKPSITKAIENGNSCTIIVGGAREVTYTGKSKIYLKNRKGFVKLAIQTGADLVPVYCFGENELFKQTIFDEGTIVRTIQELIKRYTGYFFPVISGTGIIAKSGNLPYQISLNVVVGSPIPVQRNENPTSEEIEKLHSIYTKDLLDLYNRNKETYGGSGEQNELEIV